MRSQVSRTGIGILRQLRTIRRSVSVCLSVSRRSFALVLTKLDFGNATLTGITSFQLDRLQAVMNVAAMIISLRYSAACTDFVCLSAYLSSLPSWCTSASVDLDRPTWPAPFSQSHGFPVDNVCGHGLDRAFPVTATRTWNSLPAEVNFQN